MYQRKRGLSPFFSLTTVAREYVNSLPLGLYFEYNETNEKFLENLVKKLRKKFTEFSRRLHSLCGD